VTGTGIPQQRQHSRVIDQTRIRIRILCSQLRRSRQAVGGHPDVLLSYRRPDPPSHFPRVARGFDRDVHHRQRENAGSQVAQTPCGFFGVVYLLGSTLRNFVAEAVERAHPEDDSRGRLIVCETMHCANYYKELAEIRFGPGSAVQAHN
jgi:hypothetical protein